MSHPTLDFKRAYLAFRRSLEQAIKPFGFSVAQFDVLQILLHEDGLAHYELQEKLAISSPTLTNILDRMERDGHVERQRGHPVGRPLVLVGLQGFETGPVRLCPGGRSESLGS